MELEKLICLTCGPNSEASCHGKAVGWHSRNNSRRNRGLEKETNNSKLVKGDYYDLKISKNSGYHSFCLFLINYLMKEFGDKRFHKVEVQLQAIQCSTIPSFHPFLKNGKIIVNVKIFLQNKITRNLIFSCYSNNNGEKDHNIATYSKL